MSKTENGLVFPSDDSSAEVLLVEQPLQALGFSETDQEWLVALFKRSDCYGDPTGEYAFRHEFGTPDVVDGLNNLKERVEIGKDNQTTLALLFSLMLNFGPGSNEWLLPNDKLKESNGSSEIPQWVSEFQRHAKFSEISLDWKKLSKVTQFDNLVPFLFPEGVPLNQVVNLDLLNPDRLQSWSSNDFNDPEQLEFWLIWRFKENKERCNIVKLDTLRQDFCNLPENILGEKVLGLCNAIFYTMNSSRSGGEILNPSGDGWKVVAHELIPFLELLTNKHPESIQERSSILKAWWHLSKLIYSWSFGGLETELTDDLRKRLVDSASKHIGVLRSKLRDTPEEFEETDVYDFYDKAFYVLLSFADPWKRIKPLLLAFTEMTKQAVAKDLRTWKEIDSTDNPPPIYFRVPNWIEVAMYSQNLRSEIQNDQSLKNLREEFAKFCLERLRTKTKDKDGDYTDGDFVEPRRAWRRCYVQALKALRVNPGGRAHRTLFWLLNNDPDETVKELAKKAHKKVRHLDRGKPNLDEGASPRRPLFEAFWWLRQAHLITLGIEIDQAGAMRTRRRELHRTREKDDRYERKR